MTTKAQTPAGLKDPKFFEIKDEAMISKMFDVSHRHRILFTLWLKNQTVRFDTHIGGYYQHLRRLFFDPPVTINQQQLSKAFHDQKSLDIHGSFQLDQVNFFFKTLFLGLNEKGQLQVEIPKHVFKLQRRANLRIPFSRKAAPKLTLFDTHKEFDPDKAILEKDLLAFRVIDVSAGGVAIAVGKDLIDRFSKNKRLNAIQFKIRGTTIETGGYVTHISETTNEMGKPIFKVGIKFQPLKPQLEKTIVQFVLDESRRLFSLLHTDL